MNAPIIGVNNTKNVVSNLKPKFGLLTSSLSLSVSRNS